jgi:hypothetical protein
MVIVHHLICVRCVPIEGDNCKVAFYFFQRKKTLLQEYRIKDKSNRFLDRRIGEKNSAMTTEDRIMARFMAERLKMHNKVILYI